MGKKQDIDNYVTRKIRRLATETKQGSVNAIYANLRRGVGKCPGDDPIIWGIFLSDRPETFSGGKTVSAEEWACYTALTLYALHQQSQNKSMHEEGIGLGRAGRNLVNAMKDSNAEERILRRFNILVRAKDRSAITYHMRSFIRLYKNHQISLDYGKLAMDLYDLQYPDTASNVYLRWGREFYSTNHKEKKEPEGE